MYQVLPVWVHCRFNVLGYVWSGGGVGGGSRDMCRVFGRRLVLGCLFERGKRREASRVSGCFTVHSGRRAAEQPSNGAAAKNRLHAHNQPGCLSASRKEAVVCLS